MDDKGGKGEREGGKEGRKEDEVRSDGMKEEGEGGREGRTTHTRRQVGRPEDSLEVLVQNARSGKRTELGFIGHSNTVQLTGVHPGTHLK